MPTPFHLARRQWYPLWFAASLLVAGGAFYFLPPAKQTPELLLSLLGSVAALFHFLYSQHNTNTDRFIALFKDFNARFDSLNESLNRIRETNADHIAEASDLQMLYDYFNLCGEEYLYFKAGYIDKEVWESWTNGMAYFAEHKAIQAAWDRELREGSYYGFSLKLLAEDK